MPFLTRAALFYLALSGVVVGLWAYVLPSSFYVDFPGLGRAWVSMDGPFNQHLIQDTGAAYLMIATLAALGLTKPMIAAPFTVGLATMAFNLLHFGYHATHLAMFGLSDKISNCAVSGLAVACSAWLLLPRAGVRA